MPRKLAAGKFIKIFLPKLSGVGIENAWTGFGGIGDGFRAITHWLPICMVLCCIL